MIGYDCFDHYKNIMYDNKSYILCSNVGLEKKAIIVHSNSLSLIILAITHLSCEEKEYWWEILFCLSYGRGWKGVMLEKVNTLNHFIDALIIVGSTKTFRSWNESIGLLALNNSTIVLVLSFLLQGVWQVEECWKSYLCLASIFKIIKWVFFRYKHY